ncbi:DUF2269 family protein [Neobacillus mesonae]|uniref:DUF2269 family protein n=1 Tax=Neobacillus mesonae TaxID=1193713 RepID=UPI00204248CE|nr:DUF2269 family protein [Neobacillus mesonae]MCM3567636.1 DUF2269 family protein [Neobacillus mesonae]
MLYNVVLFVHILGAMVMFAAVGITLTAMISMLYSVKTEGVRNWSALAVKLDGLLPFSVILILLPGLYLVFTSWGWGNSWVELSLALLIIMTIMGPVINLRRLKAILQAASEETNELPSAVLLQKVRDRGLWISVSTMTMLTLAILFLMTVKLGMIGSIVTVVLAIILGPAIASILIGKASAKIFAADSNSASID